MISIINPGSTGTIPAVPGGTLPDRYTVHVLETHDETPTVRSIHLSKPAGFVFKTSQAVRLILDAGQGPVYHPLSIASAPTRSYLEFAVRRSPSAFKQAFFELEAGDTVEIVGPRGRFPFDPERPAVLIG